MIIQWYVTIPELSGTYERKVYLYLPDNYETTMKRYPVMYMFDGHNVFFDEDATYGKSWGMKEYLDSNNKDIIIVAVSCNQEGNHRLEEYSPIDFEYSEIGKISGRGAEYIHWLGTVLKPQIDAKYRTLSDPANTIICGSSMGGLMALYAVCSYNAIFQKAAALSPSLWINPGESLKFVNDACLDSKTCIYMDYGSVELQNHSNTEDALNDMAALLNSKGATLTMQIVPGGTHCEASWERQIPVFMDILGL